MSPNFMNANVLYSEASIKTANNLRTIARSIQSLSRLTLPEIDAAVDLVSQMVPAGNVPGMVLNGLARLQERRPPAVHVKRDIELLMRGVEQVLDRAVYGTFFAGPAAVIWGYQNLLRLADKDPSAAFPDGTWQFYLEYALREDTARHANETHGFDTALNRHQLQLSMADRITAWTMACIHCLHGYDAFLENEWRERIYCSVLAEVTSTEPDATTFDSLYTAWEKLRPYGRGRDSAANENYSEYRRRRFDEYLRAYLTKLPDSTQRLWQERIRAAEQTDLPSYQRQMSILAYLQPGAHGEARTRIHLQQAHVGVIHQGTYHLIPICKSNAENSPDVSVVRSQVTNLLARPSWVATSKLAPLAQVKRAALAAVYRQLDPKNQAELSQLRHTPILLNFDQSNSHMVLSKIRQAERGIGDHALTIFDTGDTFVFDQSHIFFDGAWGAALAEILTNEALSWAVYLSTLPPIAPSETYPHTLIIGFSPTEQTTIANAPRAMTEVSAETDRVDIKAVLSLRKLLKRRNEQIQLTVNDLLVLYRAIHALHYRLPDEITVELQQLARSPDRRGVVAEIFELFETSRLTNPTLLIPVDASQRSPRDRLYPMAFEVPLVELELLELHEKTMGALNQLDRSDSDRQVAYTEFDQLRRTYLATLAGFGAVINRAKEIALMGESASVGSIRLLAHMPTPVQRLLDKVPEQFDLLNDLIKGREVFSNVGAVAPTSTLTRFISAKDDNEKKTLVWGVLTDAAGVMRISLRDFRPYVSLLNKLGCDKLAEHIARDYLDSYATGFNRFIYDLERIASTRSDS